MEHDPPENPPPTTGRVMALDVGRHRIGVALSDELRVTARGLPTRERTTVREDLDHLADIAAGEGVTAVVIGLARHMDGNASRQGEHAQRFAERLARRTGLPMRFQDERLTSREAEELLRERDGRRPPPKGEVDRVAAVLILEEYLRSLDRPPAEEEPAGT